MIKVIDYNTIDRVLSSWETSRRRTKNFESTLGELIATRLLEKQPKVAVFFGDKDGDMPKIKHFETIVQLIDTILQLLGPDFEVIEEILRELGYRHKKMGVSPSFFPSMGDALLLALEECRGEAFDTEDRDAWEEVYGMISDQIVQAVLAAED